MLERARTVEGRDADGNYGEHGLTPAMYSIEAHLEHGHLVEKTKDFALKSADRCKEKLATLIERYPQADPQDLVSNIHDAIRYTFIFDFEYYTEGVELGHRHLEHSGYKWIDTKPNWHGDEYKGVNSRWQDPPTGQIFEVQFHTQESWHAKQITHKAYERIQSPDSTIEEVESLRAYQREVSAKVPIPPGALDIGPYKKKV